MECCGPASGSDTPRDETSDCTLDDAGRLDRLGLIRREILPHVTESSALADGFAWECAGSGREKLERWIALERACCEHVSFEMMPRSDGSSRLEVRGDDPAVALLASLVSPDQEVAGVWRRLATAGGFGAAASFTLLCLLPMALAAMFGSAIAAPLAGLESPATLAGGALAFAGVIVWVRRRRRRVSPAAGARTGTSPCGC
jgi:hypothetical protein